MLGSHLGMATGRVRVWEFPTSPRLLKTIPIPVPFKKLNGTGRVWEFSIPPPAPFSFFLKKKKLKTEKREHCVAKHPKMQSQSFLKSHKTIPNCNATPKHHVSKTIKYQNTQKLQPQKTHRKRPLD